MRGTNGQIHNFKYIFFKGRQHTQSIGIMIFQIQFLFDIVPKINSECLHCRSIVLWQWWASTLLIVCLIHMQSLIIVPLCQTNLSLLIIFRFDQIMQFITSEFNFHWVLQQELVQLKGVFIFIQFYAIFFPRSIH